MESRIDLMQNELGGKIAKRIYALGQVIETSTVPKRLRELISLRTSQINGCAPCVDMHTKEAAAAGETLLRLNLVAV